MQRPDFYVRKIRTSSDNQIFSDLYNEQSATNEHDYRIYKVRHIVPAKNDAAYVLFEQDCSMIPVQFQVEDEVLTVGDDDDVLAMNADEIMLLLSTGNITIDGVKYLIENSSFELDHTSDVCQRLFVIHIRDTQCG